MLRSLLEIEPARDLRSRIFDALRFHFTTYAATALKQELGRATSSAPPQELQKAIFVFSRPFGVPDAEAERWRGEARERDDEEIVFHFPFEPRSLER